MENRSSEVLDLTLPENNERSQIGVYLKIVFVPIAIFVVFLLGFLKVIDFKVELHSIVMMAVLLVIALILARHNAEYGCCAFESRIDNFKKELKEFIMSHLLVIAGKKKSDAKFEDFSDEYALNLRNPNYASVAAGIFPMLGILGTFISIAISMPQFSSSDINSLEKEIAQLLGGVGTAFYVSIYGIFLALWWIYFEKKGISKYQNLVTKYKFATRNFFWHKDEIMQSYLQEILDKNEKVVKHFESMASGEFNEKLSRSIEEKFQNFQKIVSLEEETLKLTSAELEKSNEMLVNSNITQKRVSESYAEIISILKSVSQNLAYIQKGVADEQVKFANFTTQKTDKFENIANSLSQELKNLQSSLGSLNSQILQNKEILNQSVKSEIKIIVDDFKQIFKDENIGKLDNSDIIEELKKSLADIDLKEKENEN